MEAGSVGFTSGLGVPGHGFCFGVCIKGDSYREFSYLQARLTILFVGLRHGPVVACTTRDKCCSKSSLYLTWELSPGCTNSSATFNFSLLVIFLFFNPLLATERAWQVGLAMGAKRLRTALQPANRFLPFVHLSSTLLRTRPEEAVLLTHTRSMPVRASDLTQYKNPGKHGMNRSKWLITTERGR